MRAPVSYCTLGRALLFHTGVQSVQFMKVHILKYLIFYFSFFVLQWSQFAIFSFSSVDVPRLPRISISLPLSTSQLISPDLRLLSHLSIYFRSPLFNSIPSLFSSSQKTLQVAVPFYQAEPLLAS